MSSHEDWAVERTAAGGIGSIRLRGAELLAAEAGRTDAAAARWEVEVRADRLRITPAAFEVAQSMVWPLRYEPGMEVVFRGGDLMPLAPDAVRLLSGSSTVRPVWPSSGVAVSVIWDHPRLSEATLALRSHPDRLEVAIAPGSAREGRQVSWWVDVRDGSGATQIEVVDYDPAWPLDFQQKKAQLLQTLGDLLVAVEHAGSTSVPGLAAKPVVDIWAALRAPLERHHIDAMAGIGYEYLGEAGMAGHDLFVKRSRLPCNLHCYPAGHPEWARHLAFRDWLRTHPAGAADYASLKRELAERFRCDRLAYTEAKSDFIEAALAQDSMAAPSS